ncbi:terpene synthase family protein [Chitinophaga dinghuensis]|uniref:Terpene synthase n=1 Tax=Chitinophaga dinghuensis TaxID=1539050 RepID=A0A327W207_9BACT|nr:terpene synthase family protein [Chitinophaga dinghuensis]RAJ82316.1 terpene synthase family protein [Chitinophaga dinghuensis]
MERVNYPKPRYPFPGLMNPHADMVKTATDNWIDERYQFLPKQMQMKYKLSNFGYITARCLPDIHDFQKFEPCGRFMLWGTVFDDYYEHCNELQLQGLSQRVVDILNGDKVLLDEHPIFHELVVVRNELRAFMPDIWMQRFNEHVRVFIDSMQWEAPYKTNKVHPSLATFMTIREITIGVHAFLDLIEIQTGTILPNEIMDHAYMKQLYALTSRIFAWCNDFFSLEKDMGREVMNLVFVVQKEYNLSFEDACTEAMRIHDKDVADLVALQKNQPDFGEFNSVVKAFASYLGTMIEGQNAWYNVDTKRYQKGGHPEENTFRNVIDSQAEAYRLQSN